MERRSVSVFTLLKLDSLRVNSSWKGEIAFMKEKFRFLTSFLHRKTSQEGENEEKCNKANFPNFPLHMNGVDVYDLNGLKGNIDATVLLKSQERFVAWLRGAGEYEFADQVEALDSGEWLDQAAAIIGFEAELELAWKKEAEQAFRMAKKRVRQRRAKEAAENKTVQGKITLGKDSPYTIARSYVDDINIHI